MYAAPDSACVHTLYTVIVNDEIAWGLLCQTGPLDQVSKYKVLEVEQEGLRRKEVTRGTGKPAGDPGPRSWG